MQKIHNFIKEFVRRLAAPEAFNDTCKDGLHALQALLMLRPFGRGLENSYLMVKGQPRTFVG